MTESLDTAAAIIRREREELLKLLREERRVQSDLQARLRQTERALEVAVRGIDQLRAQQDDSTERTLAIADLHEQIQSLRQQQAGLIERLAAQAVVVYRLRIVCQQSQMNVEYLTGEPVSHEVDPQLSDVRESRVVQAREDERKRLAREIHDGPAQVLVNAVTELEYCQRLLGKDPGRAAKMLERLTTDLREGLAEVRSMIFDLRPGPLAEFGLVATLRRYAENYQSRFGIRVDLDLDEGVGRLLIDQELAIYRIVQEALQNVRKHSGASRVLVRLAVEGDVVVAEVHDNGSGFCVTQIDEKPGQHYGLTSMRERARLIQADLRLDSAPGRGTTVTLRVPRERDPARLQPIESSGVEALAPT